MAMKASCLLLKLYRYEVVAVKPGLHIVVKVASKLSANMFLKLSTNGLVSIYTVRREVLTEFNGIFICGCVDAWITGTRSS